MVLLLDTLEYVGGIINVQKLWGPPTFRPLSILPCTQFSFDAYINLVFFKKINCFFLVFA